MIRVACIAALLGCLSSAVPAHGDELARIADVLRPIVLEHLPQPLHHKEKEWGRTSATFSRLSWKGGKPRVIKVPKNDGNWRRWTITARDPQQSFSLTLTDIPAAGADGAACHTSVSMLVGVEMEQELWENGVRLWRRHIRARMRVKADFDCLVAVALERKPDAELPEAVIRPKLSNVQVGYSELVVEHIVGVGGTAAKLVGKALVELVDEVKPSLEDELLAKAKAAVEKAANKQEIRVSLTKWLAK